MQIKKDKKQFRLELCQQSLWQLHNHKTLETTHICRYNFKKYAYEIAKHVSRSIYKINITTLVPVSNIKAFFYSLSGCQMNN